VKLPKSISHEKRLVDVDAELSAFAAEAKMLGEKLAVVLFQLPPSFAFDAEVFETFHRRFEQRLSVAAAVEPRHPSWFDQGVDALLAELQVARVAADPAVVPSAAHPGGWPGLRYFRLHGSPITYRSSYTDDFLDALATRLGPGDWCIFDNTASGAALGNAVDLLARLRHQ
jgi:uncharacterized protein YecE (DUF72 family)